MGVEQFLSGYAQQQHANQLANLYGSGLIGSPTISDVIAHNARLANAMPEVDRSSELLLLLEE